MRLTRATIGVLAALLAATALPSAQAPARAAPVAQAAPLPSAEEILARYRAAIGGEEAIRKHSFRSVKGTFEIPAQGIKGNLSVVAAAPNSILFVVTLPGLGELQRGYDGKLAWSIDPAIGPRLLEGRELDEFRHSADFYDELHDPAKFKSITVVGRTQFEGQDVYEVKLVRDSGFEYTEFFSVESGLMVGGKLNASSHMGQTPMTSVITEYKPFDGLLLPTVTRQRTMGLEQVITVGSVSFDAVDPKTFELPPVIAALAGQKK